MLRSARVRLADAGITVLSPESRFDTAYNASHALALAALRRLGYRSEYRFIVFQCLQHTAQFGPDYVAGVLTLSRPPESCGIRRTT